MGHNNKNCSEIVPIVDNNDCSKHDDISDNDNNEVIDNDDNVSPI